VRPWVSVPVGVVCLALAIIITLPIPLGHVLPGTAICILAIGFLEGDGIAIGGGLAFAVGALVIIAFAMLGIVNGLDALTH
jgi:hypothetical protein